MAKAIRRPRKKRDTALKTVTDACVTYFPSMALLERTDVLGTSRMFQYTAPAIGFLFLALSLRVWEFGVRHYRSTGS